MADRSTTPTAPPAPEAPAPPETGDAQSVMTPDAPATPASARRAKGRDRVGRTYSLSTATDERLRRVCDERMVSPSVVVDRAVSTFLDHLDATPALG